MILYQKVSTTVPTFVTIMPLHLFQSQVKELDKYNLNTVNPLNNTVIYLVA